MTKKSPVDVEKVTLVTANENRDVDGTPLRALWVTNSSGLTPGWGYVQHPGGGLYRRGGDHGSVAPEPARRRALAIASRAEAIDLERFVADLTHDH